MRVYCFSDYHNEESLLPQMRRQAAKSDLVISAGDHSIFEFDQDKTLKAFNTWKKPMLLFHGNHEEATTLKKAASKYPRLTFSHGEEIIKDGVRILTWGGGGFTTTDRELDKKVKEWIKSEHKGLPTIFVTHAPPQGTKLDDLHGRHVGNKSITRAIKQLKPKYAVSGHIHEAEGAEDTIGETTCYNLGPIGRILTIQ